MVIILRGCSGSGKSTAAKAKLQDPDTDKVAVVSADHFFSKSGKYEFDFTKLGEAHADCMKRFTEAVTSTGDEFTVLVDNTNTSMREVKPYATKALANGHSVRIITIVVDPKVAHARNAHEVPFATVEKQSQRLKQSIGTFPDEWNEEVVNAG